VVNIKMGVGEILWGGMGWIGLAQDRDRVEDASERGNKPFGSKKVL
jgi:hypothetical protein